jgi:prevent-host-death family protein
MGEKNSETVIPAGKFKASVLRLLDRVARTGRDIIITKHGKPVARLAPVRKPRSLKGSVIHEGDIVSPVRDEWEVA